MEGRVKITVIATGFDRVRAETSPAANASRTTPTDLTAYKAPEPPAERLVMKASPIVLARRPGLDLASLAARHAVAAAAVEEGEDPSPLDVPAFLRRHEG